MTTQPPYRSLEDFLASTMLTIDGAGIDDGWGGAMAVKGREIEATILFADIAGFSVRTAKLDPSETLAFVNHFFAWISAEALEGSRCIIDKYIGDEIMLIFSDEFGSQDPFAEALRVARWIGQNDVFAFCPHMGIASGRVIVGYVGTALKYNCSVFGGPVAVAARCAGLKPDYDGHYSSSAAFPADEWGGRNFDEVFPGDYRVDEDGSRAEIPHAWKLLEPAPAELKNMGSVNVRHLVRAGGWFPQQSADERARETVEAIGRAGRRWMRPSAEGPPRAT